MPKKDSSGRSKDRQVPGADRAMPKEQLPPPIPQFETQGSAMPPLPGETGGPGQSDQDQKRPTGVFARLRASFGKERRQRQGKGEEHYDYATPGRLASPDRLRNLPTSFRRVKVRPDLATNRSFLQQAFGESWDIVYRDLVIGDVERPALLVFVDGLVDKEAIQRFAIFAMTIEARTAGLGPPDGQHRLLDALQSKVIGFGEIRLSADLAEITDRLVSGETVVFVAGETAAIVMDTRGWRDRGVQEPATEVTVRGPREGFNETLKTSTALLRRRLKTPLLRLERTMVGDYTRTDIVVAYIDGLANMATVQEVRRRLNRISIDGFLESSYIEELIQDDPATFFPLVRATEYPDRVAAALLEGNVAIMADTTPFTLLVPATLVGMLQAAEDHYERPAVSSAVRLIRVICLIIAVYGSALYVAATSFHVEILPLPLLERLVAARVGVPFGSFIEALILETSFEILREAGVRLPRAIGQAVSIVGALVLGDAAVSAGLVSPAVVIVVALSAICSLALPPYFLTLGMRLLRFPLIALAGTLGVFGLSVGTVVLITHLCSLKSFGVPYLDTLAPFRLESWKRDVIIRAPRWAHDRRPAAYGAQQPNRTAGHLKPGPGHPNQPPASKRRGSNSRGGQRR